MMPYSDIVEHFLFLRLEVHGCIEITHYMFVSLGVTMASSEDYVCDFQYNHCISIARLKGLDKYI